MSSLSRLHQKRARTYSCAVSVLQAQPQQGDADTQKGQTQAQKGEAEGSNGPERKGSLQPAPVKENPSAPNMESLDKDLKAGIGLLLVVFVVGITTVWVVIAKKISSLPAKVATAADLQALAKTAELQALARTDQLHPLATAAQLEPLATTAQLQPLATNQQLRDVQGALEVRIEALRSDITRLMQDVTLIKGSNDSVLNLFGRLVPGLPPQIVSLVPAAGPVGAAVVILGNNFLNGCRVWFGTVEVQPTQVTDTAIRLTVPTGATGDINVYVQGQNGVSTPLRFTVTQP